MYIVDTALTFLLHNYINIGMYFVSVCTRDIAVVRKSSASGEMLGSARGVKKIHV